MRDAHRRLDELLFDPTQTIESLAAPTLPQFLDEIVLCGLPVGGGSADVALRRSNRHVMVDVLDRKGSGQSIGKSNASAFPRKSTFSCSPISPTNSTFECVAIIGPMTFPIGLVRPVRRGVTMPSSPCEL